MWIHKDAVLIKGRSLFKARFLLEEIRYMIEHDHHRELLYLINWDINNLHRQPMTQKLPVDDFKQRNNKLNFYGDFIKPMIKTVTGNTSLKLMLIILRPTKHTQRHSYLKE